MEERMARINVEDKLFTDPRFFALLRLLPKELPNLPSDHVQAMAIGQLVLAWRAAQNYWIDQDHPESGIPMKVLRLPLLLAVTIQFLKK
jgi:hypothetical protein